MRYFVCTCAPWGCLALRDKVPVLRGGQGGNMGAFAICLDGARFNIIRCSECECTEVEWDILEDGLETVDHVSNFRDSVI